MGASLLVAFGAGLLSFLSPCVLPLVPVYVASLFGAQPGQGAGRMPVFLRSLSFVAGFALVFSLWGAGLGLIGSVFTGYAALVRQIAGSMLIIFGLFMLAALWVPWLNYEKRLSFPSGAAGCTRSFLTGAILCLAWTPCVGPVLGGILTLAGNAGSVLRGTALLAVYSLGLGLPFLVVGAASEVFTPLLRRVSRYTRWVYLVSSLLLIIVGILVLTNRLNWLTGAV